MNKFRIAAFALGILLCSVGLIAAAWRPSAVRPNSGAPAVPKSLPKTTLARGRSRRAHDARNASPKAAPLHAKERVRATPVHAKVAPVHAAHARHGLSVRKSALKPPAARTSLTSKRRLAPPPLVAYRVVPALLALASPMVPVLRPPEAEMIPTLRAPEPPIAAPPVVAYLGGSLAVSAQNASLQEILNKIRESTGAAIEAPDLDQRVTVQLGPQPPVQIIAALLEGMHLNYAILGGTSEQDRIKRVIITQRPVGGPTQPLPPPPPHVVSPEEAAKARARAQRRIDMRGGDEGVWDDDESSSPL